MSELDDIRKNTDMSPAVEPDKPPPMRCPACGVVMYEIEGTMQCSNPDCETYA